MVYDGDVLTEQAFATPHRAAFWRQEKAIEI
jgi:hypothetical protein